MSRTVRIHGDQPSFPVNACVNCLRPAERRVPVVKVKGRLVRKVSVPLCDDCVALRQAKSRRQVLFERVAVASSLLLALAVGMWAYASVVAEEHSIREGMWGALVGTALAVSVFGLMYAMIRPWAERFRGPESKAVWRAITIREFDWDTTTLEFANEAYAERFEQVNPVVEL
jgi:hypothetical protein